LGAGTAQTTSSGIAQTTSSFTRKPTSPYRSMISDPVIPEPHCSSIAMSTYSQYHCWSWSGHWNRSDNIVLHHRRKAEPGNRNQLLDVPIIPDEYSAAIPRAAPIAEERVVPGELAHTPPIHEHLRTIPPLSIKNLVSDSFHVVRRFKAVANAVPLKADVRCNQAAPPAVARETVGRAVARPFSCHQHHVESSVGYVTPSPRSPLSDEGHQIRPSASNSYSLAASVSRTASSLIRYSYSFSSCR